MRFEEMAIYCEKTYGNFYNREEEYFICPECGEIIYKCDWTPEETHGWACCPICEINLYEDVE